MPVASPDYVVTVPGSPVTIRVLDNDQGEALALVGLSSPAHGSVTANPDRTLTYTSEPGFAGAELANYPIWSDWTTLVGPTIARHAQPRRLRRGVLVIAVDGPEWMHELHFMKRELRERLNAHVGRPIIREVFLVLASDDERR